jgi:tetratricopeptide (TPR) repeat protein
MKYGFLDLVLALISLVCIVAPVPVEAANAWQDYKNSGEQAELDHDYARAERWYAKALTEADKAGPHSPQLEESVSRLATIYVMDNKFNQAEPFFRRALTVALGDKAIASNPEQLVWLDDLADAYASKELKNPDICFSHAIEIREKISGGKHTKLGSSLYAYSSYLYNAGRFKEAMSMAQKSVAAFGLHGKDSGDVMRALIFLGSCQGKLGQYAEANKTLDRAMVLVKKFVSESEYESSILQLRAEMLAQQKKYKDAETLYLNANKIDQRQDGNTGVTQGNSLHGLAALARRQGNYAKAADYYRRQIALYEKRRSPQAIELIAPCTDLSEALQKLHRNSEAKQFESRALRIQTAAASTPSLLPVK